MGRPPRVRAINARKGKTRASDACPRGCVREGSGDSRVDEDCRARQLNAVVARIRTRTKLRAEQIHCRRHTTRARGDSRLPQGTSELWQADEWLGLTGQLVFSRGALHLATGCAVT